MMSCEINNKQTFVDSHAIPSEIASNTRQKENAGRSTCTRCFKASINREYMGTRRYGISLRVFNSIAHE